MSTLGLSETHKLFLHYSFFCLSCVQFWTVWLLKAFLVLPALSAAMCRIRISQILSLHWLVCSSQVIFWCLCGVYSGIGCSLSTVFVRPCICKAFAAQQWNSVSDQRSWTLSFVFLFLFVCFFYVFACWLISSFYRLSLFFFWKLFATSIAMLSWWEVKLKYYRALGWTD